MRFKPEVFKLFDAENPPKMMIHLQGTHFVKYKGSWIFSCTKNICEHYIKHDI